MSSNKGKGITVLGASVIILFTITGIAYSQWQRPDPTGERVLFTHEGRERQYRIFVPERYNDNTTTPLVLCFHGGGGSDDQASAMGLTQFAKKKGFIVVYPNAINKHWNDGRESELFVEHDNSIDDVAFAMAVINRVKDEYTIDSDRIFSMGISNGGFMTQRLAIEHSETFSAVAIVIATMAKPLKESFAPNHPVSILYLNGTMDPIVPYDGGEVVINLFPRLAKFSSKPSKSRGHCISTDEAIELWLKQNGIANQAAVTKLADKDASDGCSIERSFWSGGKRDTNVALYKVVGGGHSLPGRDIRMPENIVGKTNQDIDGFEVIWDFFESHGRKPAASNASSDDASEG
ncbi:Alpha/beta hydrolase family protein [Novipirellula galeiformis]|uniref:Alpha/beta hydrolase family protein n=1 Tax=Novipirellula galeiformis TaxID=2528004 RepID=A0A5C6CA93_9BACT|nr:PHB depolymerase family esterase [Novipirellula galeiformis]TWU20296.1 Alpha/beta hydrolase family protein [Novipirellula galeiformis]